MEVSRTSGLLEVAIGGEVAAAGFPQAIHSGRDRGYIKLQREHSDVAPGLLSFCSAA